MSLSCRELRAENAALKEKLATAAKLSHYHVLFGLINRHDSHCDACPIMHPNENVKGEPCDDGDGDGCWFASVYHDAKKLDELLAGEATTAAPAPLPRPVELSYLTAGDKVCTLPGGPDACVSDHCIPYCPSLKAKEKK